MDDGKSTSLLVYSSLTPALGVQPELIRTDQNVNYNQLDDSQKDRLEKCSIPAGCFLTSKCFVVRLGLIIFSLNGVSTGPVIGIQMIS